MQSELIYFTLTRSLHQVRQIKMMIAKAGSLSEVERLTQMLKAGQMPGMETQNGAEEMEQ